MKKFFPLVIWLLALAACAPTPAPAFTPALPVAAIETAAMQTAQVLWTASAPAASPAPTLTPAPIFTPTETLTPEPTAPLKRPLITAPTTCWRGPGPKYELVSHVEARRYVELLGVGSVPGWYVIRNPYFRTPCWIEAIYLKLDPRMDTSAYPAMTPTNP